MYDSLKQWINVPITIIPFKGRTGTGSKIFGDPYEIKCYPKGEVNIVRNWQGVEIVSHNQLYIDGSEKISKLDSVLFENEELPVQAISTFYREGSPDMKVVYI